MGTSRWNIDPTHSSVQFTIRHLVISKVRGAFKTWQGSIDFDPQSPESSKVTARIEAASIDTRETKRDDHLRSADFFDVEKYPELVFTSSKVEKKNGDKYLVTGDLTIHGVTHSVELDAELQGTGKDPWGNERIAFEGRTTINRKDFGLGWNQVLEAGGVLVGEQVEIGLDIQAIKAAA